jgi:hypothetical protein
MQNLHGLLASDKGSYVHGRCQTRLQSASGSVAQLDLTVTV